MIRAKTRKCANKACGERFTPTERHPFAIACCTGCEIIVSARLIEKAQAARAKAQAKKAAADRKETKAKLTALKGLSYWEGRAQHAVNKFARTRDAHLPCISCGITYSNVWHGGHFVSVGANSTLRYVPANVNKQCLQCNVSKSGNLILYRAGMLAKYGPEVVEFLESWHPPVNMTIAMCQAIEIEYDKKTRALLAARELSQEAA